MTFEENKSNQILLIVSLAMLLRHRKFELSSYVACVSPVAAKGTGVRQATEPFLVSKSDMSSLTVPLCEDPPFMHPNQINRDQVNGPIDGGLVLPRLTQLNVLATDDGQKRQSAAPEIVSCDLVYPAA